MKQPETRETLTRLIPNSQEYEAQKAWGYDVGVAVELL